MRRGFLPVFLLVVAGLPRCAFGAPAGDPEHTFAQAESLMRAGKIADAAEAYEQAIREKPDLAEAYFALGVSYTRLGKTREAATALRSYLKFEPKSADGRAVLGIVLLGDGRLAEARPELEQAVRLDPSQAEAVKALARLYTVEGHPARAIPLLRSLVESPAADDEARTIFARALIGSASPTSAVRILDQMLATNPNSLLQTYILAAVAARDSHDIPKAMQICEQGVRAFPNSERIESVYVSLPSEALVARANQRLEQLRKQPNAVEELIAVGRFMTAAGKGKRGPPTEVAETLLARAVQLDPQNAVAWYHYGRCLMTELKPARALPAFRNALSFVREDDLKTLILVRIGLAEASLNQTETATDDFQRSLALNRKLSHPIPEVGLDYYWFLVQCERDVESQALLAEILQWEPLFTPARLEHARVLVEQGQPEKAIEDAFLAIQNTDDPEALRSAHYMLMKAYRALGKDQAVRAEVAWIKSH